MFNENNPNSPFNQLFNNRQLNQPKERSKGQQLALILTIGAFIFYPFVVVGVPLFFLIEWLDKKDQMDHIEDMDYKSFIPRNTFTFGLTSFLLFCVNAFLFVVVMPRGYFSAYLLFPFNLIKTTLVFNHTTVLSLLFGSLTMSSCLLTIRSFSVKRKVQSKEVKRLEIQNSKAYKRRLENKFMISKEETDKYNAIYEEAKRTNDIRTLEALKNTIYLGQDEYGKPYFMTLKEFNQHAGIIGTTGSGKTTALEILIEHCTKFDIPCLILDGKGAKDTLVAAQKIAALRDKKVKTFSDTGDVSYNPIKYGGATSIKDKLVSLAETESVYYSGASELLIVGTVNLMDNYDVKRTFQNFSTYLLPRNVLDLFAKEIEEEKPDLFTFKVEPEPKKKSKKKEKKKKADEQTETLDDDLEQLDEDIQQVEEEVLAHEEVQYVTLEPSEISLEQYYGILNHNKDYLCQDSLEIFHQLFTRYEHKSNVFYLYATSENLQTQMNILMDSELGHLFDTESNTNELDLLESTRNGEVMYVSLNGLVYTKFIRTLAQFIVSDINYLAAERYEISEDFPFMILFDEPSSYLTDNFIDTANKTRGAGVHAVFSPQTLADIDKIDPLIRKQLIGNLNTYFVGQTNEPTEIDYWLKLFGTYNDVEVTSMIEQQSGYSDVNRTDWQAERGTQRRVENFIVTGQMLRDLRTGEFIIYRKGANTREPIRKVYLRKVS